MIWGGGLGQIIRVEFFSPGQPADKFFIVRSFFDGPSPEKINKLAVYSYLTRCDHMNTKELAKCSKNICQETETTDDEEEGDDRKLGQGQIARYPGPLSQDLMSGWKQPESDKNIHQYGIWSFSSFL